MFARQVRLARAVAKYLENSEAYELLPRSVKTGMDSSVIDNDFPNIHIIVLFRAKDGNTNSQLVKRINTTRRMYVSGTSWEGKPASRIAISTWKVDVERDLKLICGVLDDAIKN